MALLAGCSGDDSLGATRPDASTPSPSMPSSTAGGSGVFTVPPGWKAVSSLGLQFAVPGGWPVQGALDCGPLPPFVVLRGGGAANACGHVDNPTTTTVSVERGTGPAGTTHLPDGRWQIRTSLQGSSAVLTATGPDAALLNKVVATARSVNVDLAGCQTLQPS